MTPHNVTPAEKQRLRNLAERGMLTIYSPSGGVEPMSLRWKKNGTVEARRHNRWIDVTGGTAFHAGESWKL
jgi:hypothetical protein